MSEEIWKDIKGFEGLYQVSTLGRVQRLQRDLVQKHYSGGLSHYHFKEKIIKPLKNTNRYLYINLTKGRKNYKKNIHRLVAEAFIDNPNNYKYINHKDSNTQNNCVDNLEWCTQSYNIKYAYDNGNKIPPHMQKVNQIQYSRVINTFISMQDAERQTGIKATNISKCCRKLRNHAGGYQWEYAE